jgi:hypothetical protein
VDHHEVVIVRRPSDAVRRWCVACGAEVDMVLAEQAARLGSVTPRAVYRWLEAASVHYLEGQEGSILICTPSILQLTKQPAAKPSTPSRLQDRLTAEKQQVPGGLK